MPGRASRTRFLERETEAHKGKVAARECKREDQNRGLQLLALCSPLSPRPSTRKEGLQLRLNPSYPKGGWGPGGLGLTWELVRNADSRPCPGTHRGQPEPVSR